MMSDALLFGFVVLPGITFGLAYHPLLTRLSVALVSPYAKADVTKRVAAATIDGMLVAMTLLLYRSSEFLLYVFIGAAYLLLRDAVAGRSVGKFLCGLVVINLETGRPCGQLASIRRNALLLLPGANVVAAFLEAATIVRDPQGQRSGRQVCVDPGGGRLRRPRCCDEPPARGGSISSRSWKAIPASAVGRLRGFRVDKRCTMQMSPYLSFRGDCEAAFKFYAECLDGKLDEFFRYAGTPLADRVPADWQNKVMHGTLAIGGVVLMGGDVAPDAYEKPKGFSLSLQIESTTQAERIFQLLAEGATVVMPLEKTFWAARFGMLVDRFGIPWLINCDGSDNKERLE